MQTKYYVIVTLDWHDSSKAIAVREDDKQWYDSKNRGNSRKSDRLKKKAIQSRNSNDWNKYKFFRNKLIDSDKKHAEEFFYYLDVIVSDFQNSNKRKFWKGIRNFVKNNNSTTSIPPFCLTLLPNGDNQSSQR